MAFLSSVAEYLNQPGGLWEWLILKVFAFIGNYGWRILLFVVLLKLVLMPLDLYQRIKMRKNQRITERMKPALDKLQQQYAGDKQTLAQKQMELNKREGFSYFSSCLPMIVTMAIFFYLFAGLNNISQYMNLKQYAGMYDIYTQSQTEFKNGFPDYLKEKYPDVAIVTDGKWQTYDEFITLTQDAFDSTADYAKWADAVGQDNTAGTIKYEILSRAQGRVVEFYDTQAKESFLWIKNVWSPDVPWTKPVLNKTSFDRNIGNYADYGKTAKKLKLDGEQVTEEQYKSMLGAYELVTDKLYTSEDNKTNGFLILPILSVGLSFLSQFITSRLQKQSGQAAPSGGMAGSMKVMMVIMPLMMGFFALQYTSAFTLYIVINSGMTILINLFTTLGMNGKDHKKKHPDLNQVQKYGRPDPKDL